MSWSRNHLPHVRAQCSSAGDLAARQLDGIERMLTRAQAAKEFNLTGSRIGNIVVIGDRDTVFGNLDSATETLPSDFRTHGSLHELNVPVVLHNARAAPSSDYFKHNFDLARWMYAV